MRFHEAATYLFNLRRFPQRPGTEATASLLAHLDNPHEEIPFVQIAGSNGKGSTAKMVESCLREAGLDVGLYTSPHLDDVRERIQVNGRKLPKSALVSFIKAVEEYITQAAATGDPPTFFETLTALALWEFGRQDVDIAVLEVGIGGRHDATSVVEPTAAAVTSVSLEHTDLLGDDIETIAKDKASVAPDGRPLVTATTEPALSAIQAEIGDTVVVSSDSGDGSITVEYGGRDGLEGVVSITGEDWELDTRLSLLGAHQATNAGMAAGLLSQLADAGIAKFESETVARGLRKAHWPGRFEVMGQEPLIVLDGAHNPDSCAAVAEILTEFSFEDLHLVVGSLADKDHHGIASAFEDASTVTACEPDHDRAEADDTIAHAFESATDASVSTRSDVAGAVADTLSKATANDCVLVTGSLYTVAEARSRWTRTEIPKRVDSIPRARNVLENAHVTEAGTWRMRGKAVHRVLKTRVQPRQAQYLKEELLSLGGDCAISGLNDQDRENLDVVMMGTMAQFKRLCGKLDGQPYGLSPLADTLRSSLEIGVESSTHGYPWEEGTAVMGILNVTPDSFHDGGEFDNHEAAIERAQEMVDAGADIIDIGGESTRPGAEPVPVEEEKARVLPVIQALEDVDALLSIDTRKAAVARAALKAGADILNDVSGFGDPEMSYVAGEYDVPIVVMHSIETPVDPERDIEYDDVVEDVIESLSELVLLAEKAGLDRSQIIVDPGLGFGKSATESFELLDRIGELQALGCPVLVGHSHKSLFEHIGKGADERYEATIAATTLAAQRGVDIIRVHDVEANATAVDVVESAEDSTQRN